MLSRLKILFASQKFWNRQFLHYVKQEIPDEETILAMRNALNNYEYSYPNLLGKNNTYKKFIILSKARSGSTLLLKMLQFHPEIICYNEIFQPERCGFDYHFFPKEDDRKILNLRDSSPEKFLKHFIYRGYKDKIKAVGFKFFYTPSNDQKKHSTWKILKNEKNLHIIHLIRKNHLHSLVSLKLAIMTDEWLKYDSSFINNICKHGLEKLYSDHKDKPKPDTLKQIHLDYEDTKSYFENCDKNIDFYSEYFSDKPMLKIYYEDIVTISPLMVNKVVDFLGADHRNLPCPLSKQNNAKLYEIISNYSDLKKKFSQTRWAVFFED